MKWRRLARMPRNIYPAIAEVIENVKLSSTHASAIYEDAAKADVHFKPRDTTITIWREDRQCAGNMTPYSRRRSFSDIGNASEHDRVSRYTSVFKESWREEVKKILTFRHYPLHFEPISFQTLTVIVKAVTSHTN